MMEDDPALEYTEKDVFGEEVPFDYYGPSGRAEELHELKSKKAVLKYIKAELTEFGFSLTPDKTQPEFLESKKTKNCSLTTTTAVKDEYPLMFSSSKRFVEPEPFPDRKVIMKVKIGALKLSKVARNRLIGLLGPRYRESDTAILPIDNHATTSENKFYAKRLFRALLGEAWLADAHYIPFQPSPVDFTEDTVIFQTEETWEEEYKRKREFYKKPIWYGSKHMFYHFGHASVSID